MGLDDVHEFRLVADATRPPISVENWQAIRSRILKLQAGRSATFEDDPPRSILVGGFGGAEVAPGLPLGDLADPWLGDLRPVTVQHRARGQSLRPGTAYGRYMESGIDAGRTWEPPSPPDPESVRLVLVSECAATDPVNDYGASVDSLFDVTTLEAFAAAGLHAGSIEELRERGIHLTVAIRHPKTGHRISAAAISASAPVLAEELASFPRVRAYLLMGDVAIAAINWIARTRNGKRAIPAGSTYRIRHGEYVLDGIRLFPSYLQAGPAWYIEASKRDMAAEDIAAALAVAGISTRE